MIPLARSNAEAHLYMDLRPCGCGEARFERKSSVVKRGDVLCSQYTGVCPGCGTVRTFVFRLPEEILMPVGKLRYGDAQPSELLDPGEWLEVADAAARADDLPVAIAAIEEILKFVPAGADEVPEAACTSDRGRAVRAKEPGRFRAVRLQAVLGAYQQLLTERAS